MAMPISNTHLRVPRGFGAILEGLTREILRDQPKDIPKYAAEYFETLLKQREETGTDPSEWAAKLEDRYYNNHSFKTSDHASRTTVSNINSQVSEEEDYSGQSEDVSMTTMKTHHFNKSEEEESSPIITQAESAKQPLVASADPTASTQADGLLNENNDSRASNNSESEGHEVQLLTDTVNIDAQESEGGREDDDQENTDQEGKPGNVNISGKDLEETADAVSVMKEDAEQKVAFESSEIRIQSPVSQLEITEQKQKQAIHDANDAISGDTEESSNNKSLAQITFDNVPENQKSMNNELRINVEIKEMTDTITNEQEVHLEEGKQDDENEENTSNHDYSMEESVEIIDTVHQPTTKGDHLVSEDTNNINNDENSSLKDNFEKVNFSQDTAATVEEGNEGQTDYQQIEHQKSFDKDAVSDSTQLADSNVKMLEEQGEILERNEDDLLEHSEEEQCQEGTLEKYFTVSQDLQSEEEEESMVDGLSDSEVKEGHPPGNQDNVNPDLGQWTDKEDTGLHEEQQDTPDPEGQSDEKQEECSRPQEEEDIMDIPLDDPEANRAAAKIQAGFRGHMTRKKMKPEDKTEGEEVSSSGDVLNGSQGAQRQEDRGQ